MTDERDQRGTTLLELVMVISIIGVIGAVASIFIKGPIDGYVEGARRAALTDAVDTTVRRMARDIRKALPNSTRIRNAQCLEFIPTKTGGRYRAGVDVASGGDILNFIAADTSFNMLGRNSDRPADQQIKVNDVIAVYNLGVPGADAYEKDNTSLVLGVADGEETTISIAAKLFPLASGGKRFHVIPANEHVVAYVCDNAGKLRRTVRDFTDSTCPATGPILASNVASCSFTHDVSDLQRNAPVQLSVSFTDSGETVSPYYEVYVNNWP
ncbi:MAG: MSHA biogenesis protein MshO [Candidatus Azotimanducaceae bacterium]|jgi:MSHA biogenesis protein MshO